MRVLVTALVPSHIVPMVPLTWALRAAGHQVLVAGDAELVKFASAAGLDTRLVGGGETRQRLTRPGAVAMPDRAGMDRRADSEWDAVGERWRTRLGGYIDDLVTLGRAWEPDLVMTDPVEFGGLVVAAALGVPGVIHRWGPDDFTSPLLRQAKVQLHGLCAEFGADGFPDPALVIDPSPASLLPEGDNTPGLLSRYVPYCGTAELPDWAVRKPERPRALLCLGMWHGRVLAETGELPLGFRHVLDACTEQGLDVLFPIDAQYHAALAGIPSSVKVVDRFPIGPVMRHTALAVHHGGSGTSMTSFASAVPQLVLPGDKPFLQTTGRLVQASGSGLSLATEAEQHDPHLVREALAGLLQDERHRKAALDVRAEIECLPGPTELVHTLEGLI
ncbi:nucleotide disphospho-sugar-binding domain-containing protein [Streptomyces violascens]|uniref:Glycosyl transferase n=1 Tax=Streptomyces violascens TaxID=67381 RepID=A0ABQ3QPB9_9ACTN|nr:nucleotide disphospho-sugar-binding domain-containing protein [Streptomyces violascens]GGU16568.1 glycosyl transferase [Streptomyces violascens]GHI39125.1 glycosyl transferase [Streptomyces violascens]